MIAYTSSIFGQHHKRAYHSLHTIEYRCLIKYALLTKRKVKLAGYCPSPFFAFLWTKAKLRYTKMWKMNKANILSHLDQTSLVNTGFVSLQKDLALLRFENNLFTLRAGNKSRLCSQHNKLTRVIGVFFVLTIFCHFLHFYLQNCPTITNVVLILFFHARDQRGQSQVGKIGPSCLLG